MNAYTKEIAELDKIVRFMESKVEVWTFSRLLNDVYEGAEPLSRRLAQKLSAYDPAESPEAIKRKVRNWLHDRNIPQNREELFKICFALELPEEKANAILNAAAESGFHYRNPKEVIYAFCLRTKKDYPEAVRLVQEFRDGTPAGTSEETSGGPAFPMTGSIRNECKRLRTEDELAAFLTQNRESFGTFHNTAYRKFRKMLDYLSAPQPHAQLDLPEEQAYSVERIVNEYLRLGVPYDRKSVCYSSVTREIKRHWPSAKSLGEMLSRKRDVERKTLLLLYLVTGGMGTLQNEGGTCFKEHVQKIDLMLTECGMCTLNPHSPFDYLLLQAIRTSGEEESWPARLEWMLNRIFGKEAVWVEAADRGGKKLPDMEEEMC